MARPPVDRTAAQQDLIWRAPATFFGAPSVADLERLDAQVAFLGVPFDGGTPQPGVRTGQAAGPAAARAASAEQFEYAPAPGADAGSGAVGWYDVESDRDLLAGVTMADVGDVAIQGSDVERNFERMTEVARRLADRGALMVAVGGDHSISFPLGRGMEALGEIDVVHVDAHADFMDSYPGGARHTGASQLRRLSELAFVRSVTALGLRNVGREEVEGIRDGGGRWASSRELLDRDPAELVGELVPAGGSLYVSVDLDVLDSSLVPGTTLPEPGGIDYRRLRALLAALPKRGRVVGFDVAELNPPYDQGGVTARLATWVVTHFLSAVFDRGR